MLKSLGQGKFEVDSTYYDGLGNCVPSGPVSGNIYVLGVKK